MSGRPSAAHWLLIRVLENPDSFQRWRRIEQGDVSERVSVIDGFPFFVNILNFCHRKSRFIWNEKSIFHHLQLVKLEEEDCKNPRWNKRGVGYFCEWLWKMAKGLRKKRTVLFKFLFRSDFSLNCGKGRLKVLVWRKKSRKNECLTFLHRFRLNTNGVFLIRQKFGPTPRRCLNWKSQASWAAISICDQRLGTD